MLGEAEEIGRRVRLARLRLGMTQADLAAAMERTQGWVSKMERGRIEIDRVGLLNQLATELHVHPNDLIGRPYVASPSENQWHAAATSIVREMRRFDLAPVFDGTPRRAEVLWGQMTGLHRLRDAAANVAILRALPDMLREARALAEVSSGHEREEAFALYGVQCKFAHTAAHSLGHPELVAIACERAAWAARLSGDPVLAAVADWMRAWDMWTTADWADSLSLLDKALNDLEGPYARGDQLALRAWGSLHLRAGVSAARAGDPGQAYDRIVYARTAADRMDTAIGPPVYDRHSLTFSSGNVAVHAVAVALDAGDHRRALQMNARTDPAVVAALPNSRQGHHHLDLARAWLWDSNRDRALAELETAERLAPQLIRHHPMARSTLRSLVTAERAGVRERLRRMSDRFHLDG
ncbi:helix-turn-helix transcriptional regulator [Frankia sp. AgB1.9]|uniref:helix-turn-helix domain-containing protein n=1 Tax=unclassified Frankia TaxID=2632575 RepID=UPI00193338FE|nr:MULTISPECIES: helix-turn-helix transcriptional regulator [unclassified Frankia]MBL7489743.1 helix-turn-helix transcriptional regulator [Frankia sp. AgW1.1]MBL7551953.1 helix-turn-helix transcriptional regulator [Frankia sp. AgB1.9]MBL7623208.1 helix-turn-helix transcriptional regulator [Frankia sp. AgB1.8]